MCGQCVQWNILHTKFVDMSTSGSVTCKYAAVLSGHTGFVALVKWFPGIIWHYNSKKGIERNWTAVVL